MSESWCLKKVTRRMYWSAQVPGLAVVLVGSRKDSETYVRNKKKACAEVGIADFGADLPEDAAEEDVLKVGYANFWCPLRSKSRCSALQEGYAANLCANKMGYSSFYSRCGMEWQATGLNIVRCIFTGCGQL